MKVLSFLTGFLGLLCLIFCLESRADKVAEPDETARSTVAPKNAFVSVQQFLAPRTKENPGLSTWPKSLNFDDVSPRSVDEFKSILQGNWSVVFHCNGRALPATELEKKGYLDGWLSQGVSLTFAEMALTQRFISPGSLLKRSKTETRAMHITSIESFGKNRFRINVEGDSNPPPFDVRLQRVRETNQLIMIGSDVGKNDVCEGQDGKKIEALFVPTPSS